MSWDIIARALFVDNGAAKGLAEFNAKVHDVARDAPGGVRAFSMMERGLQSLAFQAAGATGPLGRVAEGLLKFGGGTGLALGVPAVIGLVGLAFKHAAEEADLAAKNVESAADRMRKAFASALGKLDIDNAGDQLDRFRQRLTEAQSAFAALQAQPIIEPGAPGSGAGTSQMGVGYVPTEAENQAERIKAAGDVVSQTQKLIADAEQRVREASEKATLALVRQGDALQASAHIRERALVTGQSERDMLLEIAAATARLDAAAKGLDETHTAAAVAANVRLARLKDENATLAAQRDLLEELDQINAGVTKFLAQPFALDEVNRMDVPRMLQEANLQDETNRLENQGGDFAFQNFNQAFFDKVQGQVSAALATTPKASEANPALIAAQSVALLGAMKQGGAGGIAAAGGGLLSGLSGIRGLSNLNPVGIGLTALGGVASLFTSNADKNAEKITQAINRMGKSVGLERVRVIVVNGRGDVLSDLYEATSHDAVPRVNGYAGEQG